MYPSLDQIPLQRKVTFSVELENRVLCKYFIIFFCLIKVNYTYSHLTSKLGNVGMQLLESRDFTNKPQNAPLLCSLLSKEYVMVLVVHSVMRRGILPRLRNTSCGGSKVRAWEPEPEVKGRNHPLVKTHQ